MPTSPIHVVVLAAGKGTRMKSQRPKVLHPLAGIPLVAHVLRTVDELQPASTTVVLGHEAASVERALTEHHGLGFVVQEPQLGTGHALLQAETALAGKTGVVLLLSGDVPLLRAETLRRLVAHHGAHRAAATVLTTVLREPFGYGRIVRAAGQIVRIVEERDATPQEREIGEVNTGIYAFDLPPLFDALRSVATENSQGEYYLPDLVGIYRARHLPVETLAVDDPSEVRGVNSQAELAALAGVVRRARVEALMSGGVVCLDPDTTYVDMDVEVGADTVLHPSVYLDGRTRIGAGCEIHAGARIVDCVVEDGALVGNYSVLQASRVGDNAVVGPFARLRPDSDVQEGAHVGNFVELKKTVLGPGSKANHLAYLGDATIGAGVNVGAGTITCNYDGVKKHPTIIEDGAFIGSDSQLVAPVRVGKGAYVAAGSSVTADVPPGALAIARSRQVNKEGWVEEKKKAKGMTE
jgi:bifunctional UDP-N-acetylglucosamine pyrophosphorylase/glucosamine-1-phosphate N-acetyltransferase